MQSLLLKLILIPLVALLGGSPETQRATTPMFKGVELYSWVDPTTRSWRLALLPGTNRNKTPAEILSAPDTAHSATELKTRISRLAQGEQVFWQTPPDARFTLPPQVTVDDIIAHAGRVGVSVHVAAR